MNAFVPQEQGRIAVKGKSDDSAEDSDQERWDPSHHSMDSKAHTSMRKVTNKQMEGIARGKDRSDRATVETVLDPRTRMVYPFPGPIWFILSSYWMSGSYGLVMSDCML